MQKLWLPNTLRVVQHVLFSPDQIQPKMQTLMFLMKTAIKVSRLLTIMLRTKNQAAQANQLSKFKLSVTRMSIQFKAIILMSQDVPQFLNLSTNLVAKSET